jgi:hypothetical protein
MWKANERLYRPRAGKPLEVVYYHCMRIDRKSPDDDQRRRIIMQ